MNDFNGLIDKEADVILDAQDYINDLEGGLEKSLGLENFVTDFYRSHYMDTGFNLFFLRLPTVLLLILTLMGFYWFGKKLFGQKVIFSTLIVLASTFLIIPTAKFINHDIWQLAFQVMAFLFMVLLFKQPKWKWRILFWLAMILGIFLKPISLFVFIYLAGFFLAIFHKDRKNIEKLDKWLFGISGLGFIILIFIIVFLFPDSLILNFDFLFSTSISKYLLFNLLALLPWLGFLPAALWDLYKKLRKKDEMAQITFAWLFFGMISFSLIFQFALAFLIGRQVENYFKPNYPYKNLVKSFSILNLVISFIGVMVLLLGAYAVFEKIGYRSVLGLGSLYWGMGFIGVLGLFSESRKMIIGGIAMSGMLAMFMFWGQVNPLLEHFNNLPKKLASEVELISNNKKLQSDPIWLRYIVENDWDFESNQSMDKKFQVYANGAGIKTHIVKMEDLNETTDEIFIIDFDLAIDHKDLLINYPQKKLITGRNGIFGKEQKFWLVNAKD